MNVCMPSTERAYIIKLRILKTLLKTLKLQMDNRPMCISGRTTLHIARSSKAQLAKYGWTTAPYLTLKASFSPITTSIMFSATCWMV